MVQDSLKNLGVYLQDHLAGSVAGIELTKRCLKNNQDLPLGKFLQKFLQELLMEQEQLKKTLNILGISLGTFKRGLAWVFEKAMRLKLNNSILEYSPLSRLIELETLLAAVNAKLDMWSILDALFGRDPRFAFIDFDQFIDQAEAQIAQLQKECLKAAKIAFRGAS